jgi:hypothetical protein
MSTPVLPSEARAKISKWHGEDVLLEGWLGECKGYNCHIFDTLSEAKIVANGSSKSPGLRKAMDNSLSIGTALNFDDVAAPMQFQKVQLFGRLSDRCRGLFVGCTDRVPDIQPSAIGLASQFKKVN